jgi:hypothetical protein
MGLRQPAATWARRTRQRRLVVLLTVASLGRFAFTTKVSRPWRLRRSPSSAQTPLCLSRPLTKKAVPAPPLPGIREPRPYARDQVVEEPHAPSSRAKSGPQASPGVGGYFGIGAADALLRAVRAAWSAASLLRWSRPLVAMRKENQEPGPTYNASRVTPRATGR